MTAVAQDNIDNENKSFWSELCGSQLARELGVVDNSQESLAKFDNFYMDYYPYLEKYLKLDEIKDKNVLEVGLGYGTVSQQLALAGANYHGLDIAKNATAMAVHRLKQHQLEGDIRTGSMLECPFADNYFDYVISIGCFHHTGDLQKCINQTHRVLKTGGTAIIMVYNLFSLRQWLSWPILTSKSLLGQLISKNYKSSTEAQRKGYDASSNDKGAPETEFFSKKEILTIFKKFQSTSISCENFDNQFCLKIGKLPLWKFGDRSAYLDSYWSRNMGLDLYIEAKK